MRPTVCQITDGKEQTEEDMHLSTEEIQICMLHVSWTVIVPQATHRYANGCYQYRAQAKGHLHQDKHETTRKHKRERCVVHSIYQQLGILTW
jgi:hypothetical protein